MKNRKEMKTTLRPYIRPAIRICHTDVIVLQTTSPNPFVLFSPDVAGYEAFSKVSEIEY